MKFWAPRGTSSSFRVAKKETVMMMSIAIHV